MARPGLGLRGPSKVLSLARQRSTTWPYCRGSSAHFGKSLFFDVAQGFEKFLANAAQHAFLVELKFGKELAQYYGAAGIGVARAFKGLELGAAALDHLAVLDRKSTRLN